MNLVLRNVRRDETLNTFINCMAPVEAIIYRLLSIFPSEDKVYKKIVDVERHSSFDCDIQINQKASLDDTPHSR